MKYLFIKPVSLLTNMLILPGIPSLIGILEDNGIECEYIELESDYLKYSTPEKLKQYYSLLKNFYINKEYLKYPEIYKNNLISLKKFYIKNIKWLNKNINYYSIIKNWHKNKEIMYKFSLYSLLISCSMFLKNLSLLLLCSYSPEKETYVNIEDILFLFNCPLNNFKDFYNEQADKIINKNPDIVGIQITKNDSLLSGLYLCYLIKQKNKNIHINIGGSYFEFFYKKFKNLKDFFGIFFDSISIGDSTKTVIELTKYVKKELPAEKVTNLLYIDNGKVKFNENKTPSKIKDLPFQSFTGYKEEDYFLPELVLPVRFSTTYSCYWHKCIFCTCSGSIQQAPFSEERFVAEIEYLSKKYKAKHFIFWDNALHPKYIEKVADLILEKKLNLKYNIYARLEKEFTYELLKKIKKSGCIAIHWGLDSGSERILEYIKKGITIENAQNVLNNSRKAGIFNTVHMIFGYPTETIEDMKKALEFVKRNKRNIHSVILSDSCMFLEGSVMNKNYEYYNALIDKTDEFNKCKINIINEIKKITKTNECAHLINQWSYLYIAKYGISKFKLINYLIYHYYNNKNKIIKKLINIYFKFITLKLERN